jgi:hypothetical protein
MRLLADERDRAFISLHAQRSGSFQPRLPAADNNGPGRAKNAPGAERAGHDAYTARIHGLFA